MRLGCRSLVALTLVSAPALAGCGLLDLDGGPTVGDAFEYLPADTYQVRFADRAAMAERLGIDDIDPRDVSDSDIDDYVEPQLTEDAVVSTAITPYLEAMKDAPLNDFDIEWQADATWGDDPGSPTGSVFVWKVGDDVDFDALAEDLEDKGYDKGSAGDLPTYSVDLSEADPETGLVGGVYPLPMLDVLLDEDDQIVAAGVGSADSLSDIADVIADDADSLADDGGMDDLVEAADGDPELAWLTIAGPSLCPGLGRPLPKDIRHEYADLGRPESRALFISGDDPEALLALQYGSEDQAKDDLEAREALVDEGVDIQTRTSFDELGDFSFEQDGDLLLIEEDFDGGPAQAARAERSGGGPGVCVPEAD